MPNIIIAIDGFSSTGKSSFAKLIAARLGILYLDSGAMYRAVTLYALNSGYIAADHTIDESALKADLDAGKVEIAFVRNEDTGKYVIWLNGADAETRIRQLDISGNVSYIAVIPFVRNFVDNLLHRYGADGCVMDGRDIGTAVFPNADLKIYMTADPAIRAQRRLDEMKAKGETASFEEVLQNVKERDYIDSHRAMNPLRKADDALELDNSHMTFDDQMQWLGGILKERFGIDF
jgi:cytidylate kinase